MFRVRILYAMLFWISFFIFLGLRISSDVFCTDKDITVESDGVIVSACDKNGMDLNYASWAFLILFLIFIYLYMVELYQTY